MIKHAIQSKQLKDHHEVKMWLRMYKQGPT